MFTQDLKTIAVDKRPALVQLKPINPDFISLTELLERVQAAPANRLSLLTAAELVMKWGTAQGDKPVWRCNSHTRGIVRADATQATCATDRLGYVSRLGCFESDDGMGASIEYELFGFDRKEFSDFLTLKAGEPLDLFCPMPVLQQTPPASEIDFTMMATRSRLIDAFGGITKMDMTWFKNLTDAPKLCAARKVKGQGKRNGVEPFFCPFEVMQWLIDPNRKKGKPINDTTAWRLLKAHFPKVYNQHSIGDPNPV